MSLILDALSRAREDANPMPGLATHHMVEPVAANRRQYLLWVALSVAVVLIAWLFMERYSAPQFPVEDTAKRAERSTHVEGSNRDGSAEIKDRAGTTEPVAQAVVKNAQPAVENAPTVIEPAAGSQAIPAATVSSPQPDQLPADSSTVGSPAEFAQAVEHPEPEHAEPVLSPSPQQSDAVAELYRNPPQAEEPVKKSVQQTKGRPATQQNGTTANAAERADQSIDVDKLLREAREEVANDSLSDHPVPFLIDLSQQTKDGIPSVYYLRHDYSNNPSLSTVVLNSKTLSVGGSPAPGMKIEEILPDSVVLNYQGTQFRLRALNSWVNL